MTNPSKRGRTPALTTRLVDLPDILLAKTASFLTKPSKAIFAVSIMAPSSTWCERKPSRQSSATSMAIVEHGRSSQWEELDFEGIEKSLASKLTDDDLQAILLCIDSVNRVKKLKLAGCINITGQGLEPICGSIILQQIDLSFVGRHDNPHIAPEPIISEDTVLPILLSIIDKDGISLRQLQLPEKWCGYRNRTAAMNRFLGKYSTVLSGRSFSCVGGTHTSAECFGTDGEDWIDSYGRQGFTCYECLENVCDDPAVDVAIKPCSRCKRSYCGECLERRICGQCANVCCYGCMAFGGDSCETCELKNCKDCIEDCNQCQQRIRCSKCSTCSGCWRNPNLEEE